MGMNVVGRKTCLLFVALALAAALAAGAGCAAAEGEADSSNAAEEPGKPAAVLGRLSAGAPPSIEGIESANWLSASEKESLAAAAAGYTGGKALRIAGGPDEVDGVVATYLAGISDGTFYEARLRPDERWSVTELSRLVVGVNAEAGDVAVENMDEVSAVTSRNATFDVEGCVPAADTAALERVVGSRCAAVLAEAVAGYVSGLGLDGVGTRDIMVEDKAETLNGTTVFKVLVTRGNERVVLSCTWSESNSGISFEALA